MPAKRSFLKSFFLLLLTLLLTAVSFVAVLSAFTGKTGMTAQIGDYCLVAYTGETMPLEKGSAVLIGSSVLKEKEAFAFETEKSADILYYYGSSDDGVQMSDGDGNILTLIKESVILGKALLTVPYVGYAMIFLHSTIGMIISGALAALALISLIAFFISLRKPKAVPEKQEEKKPEVQPSSRTEIFGSSKQPSRDALSTDKKETTVLGKIKTEEKDNAAAVVKQKTVCAVMIDTDAAEDVKKNLNAVLDSREDKYIFKLSGSKASFLAETIEKILEKKNGKAVSEISNESIIFKADRESALTICSLIAKLLKA